MKPVTIRVATLLPDDSGRLTFDDFAFDWIPGRSLTEYLETDPSKIALAIYFGAVVKGDALGRVIPLAGDVVEVVPSIDGKNSAIIMGVVGAVVGGFFFGPAGATWSWSAAMAGFSIGSTLGALLVPRPRVAPGSDDNMTSYMWGGIQNEDRAGTPKPVILGRHRAGGTRISYFIRRNGDRSETMNLLLLASKGEVEGLEPGTVEINGQPAANFPGVTIETRNGTDDQTAIKGFDVIANTYQQSIELGDSWQGYTTLSQVDNLELLFTFPQGLSHADSKGIVRENTFVYKVRHRPTGGPVWTELPDQTVVRSTRSQFFETFRIDDLPRGQYDVQVKKISVANSDQNTDTWIEYLTGVTEEIDELRTYPRHALLAVRAIATEQLGGAMPTVTAIWKGLKVPTWNGASWDPPAWTRNRGWLVLQILRDRSDQAHNYVSWGAGDHISDEEIDLDSWKTFADRCAEQVTVELDDSTTYQEDRHYCDVVLNQQKNALDLMIELLAPARAVPLWSGNQWRVAVDKPAIPVQTFSMANIGQDSLELTYQMNSNGSNALEVQILDEDLNWEAEPILVPDPVLVVQQGNPIRKEQLALSGVTRRTEAFREARYRLNQNRVIRRTAKFNAFTESVLLEAGDVFNISHDLPQWGYSGQVMPSSTDSVIVLDRGVDIVAGQTYELRVVPQDGSNDAGEIRTVANAEGSYNELTVSIPFSFTPQEGDTYAFGPTALTVKPFRAIAITRSGFGFRQITALEHNESVLDDSGVIAVPNYSLLPNFGALPPAIPSLTATQETVRQLDGSVVVNILLQWPRPISSVGEGIYLGAKVERSWNGTNWESLGSVDGTEFPVRSAPQGVHLWFRVIPYSTARIFNPAGAAQADLVTAGDSTLPGVVANFVAATKDGSFQWTWDELDPNVEYELRTANPASWSADPSGFLWRGRGQKYVMEAPDSRSVPLWIRARDRFGNYSIAAVTADPNDVPPAAPTVTSISRFKNAIKVKVTPPAGVDIIGIYLHASSVQGFAPAPANRVAGVVSPAGGEFLFQVPDSGTYYFRATCADWLSGRLADFVYSAEQSGQIQVVAPVDPTQVTLVEAAPDAGNPDSWVLTPSPDGSPATNPRKIRKTRVSWFHNDNTNAVNLKVGFELFLYLSTDVGGEPIWTSGVLTDATLRTFVIDDPKIISGCVAGVKAIYIDGITSNIVTSDGVVIPQDTNPLIQNQDDRTVMQLTESFDAQSFLPTGFTVVGLNAVILPNLGILALTRTAAGTCYLQWRLDQWMDAYLDSRPPLTQPMALILRMTSPVSMQGQTVRVFAQLDAVPNSVTVDFPVVSTDTDFHTYRVPLGLFNLSAANIFVQVDFTSSGLPVNGEVDITAIGVAWKNVDVSLDGHVDRALNARDQFDQDPTGRGFFLRSPIRQPGDQSGSQVVIDENGLYWLRDDNGDLITETPYRLGRNVLIDDIGNGDWFQWGVDGVNTSGDGMSPSIPHPTSVHKARFLLTPAGAGTIEAAIAAYPVRDYAEVTEVNNNGGLFRITHFEGGTPGLYVARGPWTQSSQAKSSLSMSSDDTLGTTEISDAWYYSADELITTAKFFRTVIWLKITMPDVKKLSGSRYVCDLFFTVAYGRGTLDAVNNRMNMSTSVGQAGRIREIQVRTFSDGQAWYVPIVIGNVGFFYGYLYQNLKVDWTAQFPEAGNSSANPISAEIDRIEWGYVDAPTVTSNGVRGSYKLTYLEEF